MESNSSGARQVEREFDIKDGEYHFRITEYVDGPSSIKAISGPIAKNPKPLDIRWRVVEG